MVNRLRQSIITHTGSEMIMFSRFASVLQIPFSKKPPNVVPHHVFHVGCGGALVEAITFNRRVVGSTPALAAM